jgi:hypothetical protein
VRVCLWVVGCVVICEAAAAQPRPDPDLLAFIENIKAVDNHSHALPALKPGTSIPVPVDPLGTSPPTFSARQRETNPEWIDAWRALYGYPHRDATPEHTKDAFSAKQRAMQQAGVNYPVSTLDRAGIEFALINAPALGLGQTGPRFRWVPYGDGFLFPFPTPDFPGNPQPRRVAVGLDKAPPPWAEFLASIPAQLQRWKTDGAVALKFTIAYSRSLDFAPVAEAEARDIYERYQQDGGDKPRDYRPAEYKALQDFLFRHVVREAGRVGLPLHIHTGEGGGPVFGISGSNPLLLESVLNDFSITPQPTIVLVHGGAPFDRAVTALLQKPNVYADISGQTFFHSPQDLSDTLRGWLWAFPEKVLFGTDAMGAGLRGWEEMTWIATRSGRTALALALTRMMAAGEMSRARAEEIAGMVLRGNALRLYKLTP